MARNSANKDDFKIGSKMRAARLDFGMTQTELAKHFGISAQQVQKFELGHNKISAKALFLLSKILGKPMEWFTSDLDSDVGNAPANNDHQKNNFAIVAMRNLRNIHDKATQDKILKIIKVMNDK